MTIPEPHESELQAWSLAALALPAGSRVLVVRSASAVAADARLTERGCVVETASVPSRTAVADGATYDAVVVADGFEQLDDPFAALGEVTALLAPRGRVLVVARNAAHARSRVEDFLQREESSGSTLPPRQYDLSALERVVVKAGLVVLDRLRVLDPPDAAPVDGELLSLISGPEAKTSRFVIVAGRGDDTVAPAGVTLAEALQHSIEEANASIEDALRRFHEVESDRDALALRATEVEAELTELRALADEQRIELDSRAQALLERVELVDRLYTERRHLELDLAVKDEYIAKLRGEVIERRGEYDNLRFEFDELLRSRHYRAAVFLHRMLTSVPFLHRIVTGSTRLAARVARRNNALPPAS